MRGRPSAEEERRLSFRAALRGLAGGRFISREAYERAAPILAGQWKPSRSWFLRIVLFGLACFGVSSMLGFISLISLTAQSSWRLTAGIGGVIALVLAEFVLHRFHPWRSGVEEALYVSAMVCLILSLPSEGKPEALLVFALAGAIVAIRCVSSGFMTIGALLVIIYAGVKIGSGSHDFFDFSGGAAAWTALALLVLASLALLQSLRRPWIERTFSTLVVILPAAIYAGVLIDTSAGRAPPMWTSLFAFLAIGALALAITRRVRPLFYTAALSAVVVGIEITRAIDIPLSGRLVSGGLVFLTTAILMERWLRTPRRGFTSEVIGRNEGLEVLRTAGAAALQASAAPSSPSAPPAQHPSGGGGSFGGAGSSGNY